jgi:transcription elongation factor GreB
MSRAFVKEQDGNIAEDDVPERPQSSGPNYVTPRGMEALRLEHQRLTERHAELKALDSSEPILQQESREVERALHFVTGRIDRAVVVDPREQPEGEVRFGATVVVGQEDGSRHTYHVVGEDEADVAHDRVSWASPLAQAMMGARVGDTVEWRRPAGALRLEIVSIRYSPD